MDDALHAKVSAVRDSLESRYPVRLLGVVGSVARGENGPDSDVDLLVEPGAGLTLSKLGAVQIALEEATGRPVDLVFESALKPDVRARVLADLRRL